MPIHNAIKICESFKFQLFWFCTAKCRNCSAQKEKAPIEHCCGQHRARRCWWWLLFSSSYFIRFCVGDIYFVAVVLFGSRDTARTNRPYERIGTTELDSFYLWNTGECVTWVCAVCVWVDSLPLGIASHAEQMLQFVLHKLEPAPTTTNDRTNERWAQTRKNKRKIIIIEMSLLLVAEQRTEHTCTRKWDAWKWLAAAKKSKPSCKASHRRVTHSAAAKIPKRSVFGLRRYLSDCWLFSVHISKQLSGTIVRRRT